jgi:plastocyanin
MSGFLSSSASRKILVLATAVSLLVAAGGSSTATASHGNLNVHVHDDFYHPAGAFGVPTNHSTAQAACQLANPSASCDAVIHEGDTITWVSPAPLAANVHTVTECTGSSFSVCGPSVAAGNPIGDSGTRNPPSPGPSGWPYGPVQFTAAGTYFYRCDIHPDVMRGRIVVLPAITPTPVAPVGGDVRLLSDRAEQALAPDGSSTGIYAWLAIVIVATLTGSVILASGMVLALRSRRIH